jgi:transposase
MHSAQARAQAIAAYYEPPQTGRPSEIGDAGLLQQLLTAIEDGNYIETACHLVGLSPVTYYNWKKRGEQGESPFDRFLNAIKEAEARAEAKMLANVRRASELPQFWAAGMTVLERRHPERWGKRQDDSSAPKVVVQIGGPADVKIAFAVPSAHPVLSSPIEAKGECDANSLSHKTYAKLSSPITAVMSTPTEGGNGDPIIRSIAAGEPDGGPQPVGVAVSPVVSGQKQRARRRVARKQKRGKASV